MNSETYHNFAFISYSHQDMAVAKWLQKKLEAFKLPTKIYNDIDASSRYLRPIFRDESDLNTGILSDELRKNLIESKYLILICSPNSAKSQWVSDEAKAFVEMGRLEQIIPIVISDGKISERELFPQFLKFYFTEHPEKELLGVNYNISKKDKTLIRIVSRILNVSFDSLWKRHLRQKRVKWTSTAITSTLISILTYILAIPINLSISATPETSNLPTGNDIIFNLDDAEYRTDFDSPHLEEIIIPGYKRFSVVHINASSKFFQPIDTQISPGFGLKQTISIQLHRDDSFAIFSGMVYNADMAPLDSVLISIVGKNTFTNSNGYFFISLPIELQRAELTITLSKEGYTTLKRDDEVPGDNLKYILHKSK